ncbi:Gfo/Idh/MocA family oxidoreductase [Rhodobacteraceae bacterium CCMM004]|nr:Gfo/Idh/MocA family oxidoreductase [Rhodobacteraceae bacterium CCMM004]
MTATPIALAGIGKIARDQHIPALAADPRWHLAATVSRHAGVEGVDGFTGIDEMLAARPDIGAVSLALPPGPRFAYAAACLRAGRHVMLEKPPGATLAECHALVAMAEAAGVTLYATWHSRMAHAVPAARDWLAQHRLRRVEVAWKEDVRRWHPGQDWIWEAGGLGVFDPGINALSILTAILPVPVHLSAADLWFPENRDTPIAADLTFAHPEGAEVAAVFDWRQEGAQTWTVTAETDAGTMVLSDGGARLAVDGRTLAEGPDREYPGLYARFADLVADGVSDVDLAPMVHVADAFTLGRRRVTDAFVW